MRTYRRRKVGELLFTNGLDPFKYGIGARIARELGVHRSTICRDIRWWVQQIRPGKPCPFCRCQVRHELIE